MKETRIDIINIEYNIPFIITIFGNDVPNLMSFFVLSVETSSKYFAVLIFACIYGNLANKQSSFKEDRV